MMYSTKGDVLEGHQKSAHLQLSKLISLGLKYTALCTWTCFHVSSCTFVALSASLLPCLVTQTGTILLQHQDSGQGRTRL